MPYKGITGRLTILNDNQKNEKTTGNYVGTPVAYISNWSVEETRDVVEITQLGEKSKEILPSLLYWSASAEGAADFSDGAQQAFRKAMTDGTPVNVRFYLDSETYLDGTAYVTAFSVNISAEDKGGVSISLTGSGELKLTPSVGGAGGAGDTGATEQHGI